MFVLGWLVAILLTYHELRMEKVGLEQKVRTTKRTMVLPPKRRLQLNESFVLDNLVEQMLTKHGYDDRNGIELDLARNRNQSEIMEDNCSICGKPRNQKGDTYAHIWR